MRKILTAVGLVIFGTFFLVPELRIAIFEFMELRPNTAAWVQAIGSLIGLFVAIYVPAKQYKQAALEKQIDKQEHLTNLRRALYMETSSLLQLIHGEIKWWAKSFVGPDYLHTSYRAQNGLQLSYLNAVLSEMSKLPPDATDLLLSMRARLQLALEVLKFHYDFLDEFHTGKMKNLETVLVDNPTFHQHLQKANLLAKDQREQILLLLTRLAECAKAAREALDDGKKFELERKKFYDVVSWAEDKKHWENIYSDIDKSFELNLPAN